MKDAMKSTGIRIIVASYAIAAIITMIREIRG